VNNSCMQSCWAVRVQRVFSRGHRDTEQRRVRVVLSLPLLSVADCGSLESGSGAKAHMQHSYSPSSSIWQGGMRFMQPGHTPWWMA